MGLWRLYQLNGVPACAPASAVSVASVGAAVVAVLCVVWLVMTIWILVTALRD